MKKLVKKFAFAVTASLLAVTMVTPLSTVTFAMAGRTRVIDVDMTREREEYERNMGEMLRSAPTSRNGVAGGVYESGNYIPMPEEEVARRQAIVEQVQAERGLELSPRYVQWIGLRGGIRRFEQLNDIYCAPAVVQSVLTYINGMAPSQHLIASWMGTGNTPGIDGTATYRIQEFLNSQQTWPYYIGSQVTQQILMQRIESSISYYDKPAIIRIYNPTGNPGIWRYRTYGHTVIPVDYRNDFSMVGILDPMPGYTFYDETPSRIFNAHTSIIW